MSGGYLEGVWLWRIIVSQRSNWTTDTRIFSPPHIINISDLTPESMQTNADKWFECGQNADQ